MFQINLESCSKAALETKGQELLEQIENALLNNREQAYTLLAFVRSTSKMLDAVDKAVVGKFEQDWQDKKSVIGTNVVVGEMVFCLSDKPDLPFEKNDDNGLYKAKMAEIAANSVEAKILGEELKGIIARIKQAHPNMTKTHNYTLSFKGTEGEINKKLKL